jgi:hypothetical protein
MFAGTTTVGKVCIFCKRTIRNPEDATKLVGGSCPPEGKPMHRTCYEAKQAYWFR